MLVNTSERAVARLLAEELLVLVLLEAEHLYADRPIGIYTEIQGGNFFEPKMLLEIVQVCPFSNK